MFPHYIAPSQLLCLKFWKGNPSALLPQITNIKLTKLHIHNKHNMDTLHIYNKHEPKYTLNAHNKTWNYHNFMHCIYINRHSHSYILICANNSRTKLLRKANNHIHGYTQYK